MFRYVVRTLVEVYIRRQVGLAHFYCMWAGRVSWDLLWALLTSSLCYSWQLRDAISKVTLIAIGRKRSWRWSCEITLPSMFWLFCIMTRSIWRSLDCIFLGEIEILMFVEILQPNKFFKRFSARLQSWSNPQTHSSAGIIFFPKKSHRHAFYNIFLFAKPTSQVRTWTNCMIISSIFEYCIVAVWIHANKPNDRSIQAYDSMRWQSRRELSVKQYRLNANFAVTRRFSVNYRVTVNSDPGQLWRSCNYFELQSILHDLQRGKEIIIVNRS